MSTTYTFTGTESYSVADVKAVMQNTFEDIVGFANREMVDYSQARKWIEDLTYILKEKALKAFEVQLHHTGSGPKAYRYEVDAFGLTSGQQSGGINYYTLPANTRVTLYADLDKSSPNYDRVLRELLYNRGWGENGSAANGMATYDRSYVSNTLQLKRSEIK